MKSNPSPVFLDASVIKTMIILIGIALVAFAFRYKNQPPSPLVAISVDADSLYTAEMVPLALETGNKNDPPKFSGPHTAFVGEPVIFKDSTLNATKWEWWFDENNTADAATQQASYIFQTPGKKTVVLVVNGKMEGRFTVDVKLPPINNSRIQNAPVPRLYSIPQGPRTGTLKSQFGRGQIEEVKEKNGTTEKKPPVTSNIQDDQSEIIIKKDIENRLIQVVDGNGVASDFAAYLCHLNIPVNYDGKKMTFNQLCADIRKIKKALKIESLKVSYIKDDDTRCIQSMTVHIKLKPWLRRILN